MEEKLEVCKTFLLRVLILGSIFIFMFYKIIVTDCLDADISLLFFFPQTNA